MDSQVALPYLNLLCCPSIGQERGRDEMTDPVSKIQLIAHREPFGRDDNFPAVPGESEKRRSRGLGCGSSGGGRDAGLGGGG